MRRGWWLFAALAAGACTEAKSARPAGLRVPLPEGWVATATASGVLEVGPKGRVVATLERRVAPRVPVEELSRAVESEGGAVVSAASSEDSVRVRYTRGATSGLLLVRPLDEKALLLCATLAVATPAEIDAAESMCGQTRLETPKN